jgi:hypothetical protein
MSLSLSYDELVRSIGREIDISRDADDWDAVQTQDVRDIVADGLRQVYWPPPLPGEIVPHEWSFLSPKRGTLTIYPAYETGTVCITSGVVILTGGTFPSWAADGEFWVDGSKYEVSVRDSDVQVTLTDTSVSKYAGTTYLLTKLYYALPADFGGLAAEQEFSLRRDQEQYNYPSHPMVVSEAMIDRHDQWPHRTGSPEMVCILPKTTTTAETSWEARFYPLPDREYDLEFRYQIEPPLLNGTSYVYHYGGPGISQAVLMSCLDKAMRFLYSSDEYYQRFIAALTAAVRRDRNVFRKESFGFGAYSDGYSRRSHVYDSLHDFRRSNTTLGDIRIG